MRNYIESGKSVTVEVTDPSQEVKSGDGVLVGDCFGVASGSARVGESYQLFIEEVYELPKDESDIGLLKRVYWNPQTKKITADRDGTLLVGVATEQADRFRDFVRVKLGFIPEVTQAIEQNEFEDNGNE